MGKTCREEVDDLLDALDGKDLPSRIATLEDVIRIMASRIDLVEGRVPPFRGLR